MKKSHYINITNRPRMKLQEHDIVIWTDGASTVLPESDGYCNTVKGYIDWFNSRFGGNEHFTVKNILRPRSKKDRLPE